MVYGLLFIYNSTMIDNIGNYRIKTKIIFSMSYTTMKVIDFENVINFRIILVNFLFIIQCWKFQVKTTKFHIQILKIVETVLDKRQYY